MNIEFDEATHRYTVDGVEFPSVTTPLNLLCDFSRIPADVLEYKRKIGRAVHKAIELYEAGTLDADTLDDAVLPYLESWMRFKDAKPLRVIASEKIVASVKHRVAGRLDLVVEFANAKPCLLDAKCVYQMAPETALQTACYAECWNEMGLPKIKDRAGLQLQPDGSIAKLYPYTNSSDFLIYLNFLNAYRWINNHRKTS